MSDQIAEPEKLLAEIEHVKNGVRKSYDKVHMDVSWWKRFDTSMDYAWTSLVTCAVMLTCPDLSYQNADRIVYG